MEKRLMTVEEAATYLACASGTLRNQMSKGILPFPFVKVGRRVLIDRRDLDSWIASLPRYGTRS